MVFRFKVFKVLFIFLCSLGGGMILEGCNISSQDRLEEDPQRDGVEDLGGDDVLLGSGDGVTSVDDMGEEDVGGSTPGELVSRYTYVADHCAGEFTLVSVNDTERPHWIHRVGVMSDGALGVAGRYSHFFDDRVWAGVIEMEGTARWLVEYGETIPADETRVGWVAERSVGGQEALVVVGSHLARGVSLDPLSLVMSLDDGALLAMNEQESQDAHLGVPNDFLGVNERSGEAHGIWFGKTAVSESSTLSSGLLKFDDQAVPFVTVDQWENPWRAFFFDLKEDGFITLSSHEEVEGDPSLGSKSVFARYSVGGLEATRVEIRHAADDIMDVRDAVAYEDGVVALMRSQQIGQPLSTLFVVYFDEYGNEKWRQPLGSFEFILNDEFYHLDSPTTISHGGTSVLQVVSRPHSEEQPLLWQLDMSTGQFLNNSPIKLPLFWGERILKLWPIAEGFWILMSHGPTGLELYPMNASGQLLDKLPIAAAFAEEIWFYGYFLVHDIFYWPQTGQVVVALDDQTFGMVSLWMFDPACLFVSP